MSKLLRITREMRLRTVATVEVPDHVTPEQLVANLPHLVERRLRGEVDGCGEAISCDPADQTAVRHFEFGLIAADLRAAQLI